MWGIEHAHDMISLNDIPRNLHRNLMLVGVDPEGQAPVACDMKTPCALAVTGHLMRFPDRD